MHTQIDTFQGIFSKSTNSDLQNVCMYYLFIYYLLILFNVFQDIKELSRHAVSCTLLLL